MESKSVPETVVHPTAFPPKAQVIIERVPGGTPQSKPTITLYVRRGEDILRGHLKIKTRTISLHPIPGKVDMDELLGLGFAFDGDTVSVSVDQYTETWRPLPGEEDGLPFGIRTFANSVLEHNVYHRPWTLTDALRDVQLTVVEWLRGLGYEVKIA